MEAIKTCKKSNEAEIYCNNVLEGKTLQLISCLLIRCSVSYKLWRSYFCSYCILVAQFAVSVVKLYKNISRCLFGGARCGRWSYSNGSSQNKHYVLIPTALISLTSLSWLLRKTFRCRLNIRCAHLYHSVIFDLKFYISYTHFFQDGNVTLRV
jgi:hypothetical protein